MNSEQCTQVQSDLFGPVLGLRGQVVEGVVGLSDPAKQHCDHACNASGKTELPIDGSQRINKYIHICLFLLSY